jgi:hypothetical protein
MKSFKEYLTESKKVYEFKVKVAGPCPKDMPAHIKNALAPYKVESCSAGKSTPIQETQEEFPSLKHVELTVFDVTTAYPANSLQVASAIAECAKIPMLNLIVRTLAEQQEYNINHSNDQKSGASLLNADYEPSNHQDMVGEKHMMSFLQELSKEKHGGQEYTGVNDEILAKGQPKHVKETPGKQVQIKTKFTNLFDKTTHVDPIKGTK